MIAAVIWICSAIIVLFIVFWFGPLVLEAIEDRRATRGEPRDDLDITDEIKAIEPAEDLATVHIAPSPMIPTRRLSDRWRDNAARLDQKARHANVVAATAAGPLRAEPVRRARPQPAYPGPITQRFDRIVEDATGTPPAGRGPREADLRAWEQLDLFAEVGA